jgi:hypothetical protein
MCQANEQNNQKCEPKRPELLPAGEKANEIIEVLTAMYRAAHDLEDGANEDDKNEHTN